MKKLTLALALSLATLFASTPTLAQYAGGTSKSCATASCALTQSAPGSDYAYAYFTLTHSGTSTVAFEQTLDGTNWVASAYAKRLSTGLFYSTTTVSGVYQVPLAGNTKLVRARISVLDAITPTVAMISTPRPDPYKEGSKVKATLYDASAAVSTLHNTGVLDTSGWSTVLVWQSQTGTPTGAINLVDDAGATSTLPYYTFTGSSTWVGFGDGGVGTTTVTANGVIRAAAGPVPKRLEVSSPAVTGNVVRFRVETGR